MARSVSDESLTTLHWLYHLARVRDDADSGKLPAAKLVSCMRRGAASAASLEAVRIAHPRRSVVAVTPSSPAPLAPDASGDFSSQGCSPLGQARAQSACASRPAQTGGAPESGIFPVPEAVSIKLTAIEKRLEDSAECARQAAVMQTVLEEARRITSLPQIAVQSAFAVVVGGRIRVMGSALEPSRVHFVRVSPSTSALWCDGVTRGTLLGALPGLTARGEAALDRSAHLQRDIEGCCFRLVLKSYELDAIAFSPTEMRAWVRGVNWLPLGAKHSHLTDLAFGCH